MNNKKFLKFSSKLVPQANGVSTDIAAGACETNAKKRKQLRLKLLIPCVVIVMGLAMVILSFILAASNYPWAILFGAASQDAQELPDPPPIKLDEEDRAAVVTAAVPTVVLETTPDVIETEEPSAVEAAIEEPVMNEPPPEEPSPSENAVLPGAEADTSAAPVPTYTILGILKIPVLKVSENLLEGAGKQMKYGVGHVTSTQLPGQKGNCAVAGHRPYPFRYLDKLQAGDSVVIKMNEVIYTYSVYESFEVLPTEVWVLNPVEGEDYMLTIITCTPYMVSSHRLIVRARLIEIDGMSPQEYYGEAEDEAPSAEVTEPEPDASGDIAPEETSSFVPPEETSDITTDEPAVSEATTLGELITPEA